MLKIQSCVLFLLCVVAPLIAEESTETVTFTPPPGWQLAESKGLPPSVKAMVIGKGKNAYPPSLNLAVEPWDKSLKEYIQLIKGIGESHAIDFKDLGTIQTEAGNGVLIQEDSKTRWGDERQMHVILLRNGSIYILTAAALKEEFPSFYKDFFASMRSLRISKGVFEMVADAKKRANLIAKTQQLKEAYQNLVSRQKAEHPSETMGAILQQVFNSQPFKEQQWGPYQSLLEKDYADLGQEWQQMLLAQVQTSLMMETK